jgi:4-alpha-glucanotransferase
VKNRWGIEDRFHDAFGTERVTSVETRGEVLRAMGIDPDVATAFDEPEIRIVRPGDDATISSGGELTLEDGTVLSLDAGATLPPDLPFGYHTLSPGRGEATEHPLAPRQIRLLSSPGACYLPDDLLTWGWAIQLYAARSRDSWGIGDLADLRALGSFTKDLGGGAVMVNPLSAPAPVYPVEPSPYYPSSRRFRNPLFLRIEEIPGAADAGDAITRLAVEARALLRAI